MVYRNVLIKKVTGAILGAVAVATIFSLVGYSDVGATPSDYLREIAVALASYLTAAFLVQRKTKRDNAILDIVGVAFIGSALSFLMKLILLEGRNGIPAYIAQSTREHSWKPFGDLLFHAVSFIILATLLSFPFVAIGVWLSRLYAKKNIVTTGQPRRVRAQQGRQRRREVTRRQSFQIQPRHQLFQTPGGRSVERRTATVVVDVSVEKGVAQEQFTVRIDENGAHLISFGRKLRFWLEQHNQSNPGIDWLNCVGRWLVVVNSWLGPKGSAQN